MARHRSLAGVASLMALLASVVAVLAVSAVPASAGPVHCVRPGGGFFCDSSIQAAVDAADPGATIWVLPGTYFENVTIPEGKDGITIRGLIKMRTTVDPDDPNTGDGFLVEADDVTIENLRIRNGAGAGIEVDGSGFTGRNLDIQGPRQDCADIDGDDATIEDSVLRRCGSEALEVDADGVTVLNSFFSNCDSDCVNIDGDGATFTGNYLTIAADGDGFELDGDGFAVTDNVGENFDDEVYNIHCTPCTLGGLVEDNIARFSTDSDHGFDLNADDGAGTMVVRGNTAIQNDHGFDINGTGIELWNNLAVANGDDQNETGFDISGNDHRLFNNQSRGSQGDGFDIGGSGHLLRGNIATNNADDGFDVKCDAEDVTLDENTANNNFGVGFEVSDNCDEDAPDSTTLTDNVASGNRVDFCDGGTNTVTTGNSFGTTGDCVIRD